MGGGIVNEYNHQSSRIYYRLSPSCYSTVGKEERQSVWGYKVEVKLLGLAQRAVTSDHLNGGDACSAPGSITQSSWSEPSRKEPGNAINHNLANSINVQHSDGVLKTVAPGFRRPHAPVCRGSMLSGPSTTPPPHQYSAPALSINRWSGLM